jgi:hypothetical protein
MGSGTQIECFNIWNHLLNLYSFARTGYDTSLSLADNVRALSRLFGDASDEVGAVMLYLEEVLDGQAEIDKCGHYLMEHIDKARIYEAYERGFALAKTARERNNLRLMRMAFRYSDLEAGEAVSLDPKYVSIREGYADPTGELRKMTEYDSFFYNDPGYAIAFPVKSESEIKLSDKWYEFE